MASDRAKGAMALIMTDVIGQPFAPNGQLVTALHDVAASYAILATVERVRAWWLSEGQHDLTSILPLLDQIALEAQKDKP